ncbi:putative P-loop containing nucleoside triphosphate hydrolase, leucine-rich repeat domain, L [Medicago truncatula]|uniref:Putative P-loop containing nucleoside triphosphate hydrolase, leucine-rich repeat domain, L n=1 Tax=Medicago truncatula TaxID=3880 RepID=A0A396J659_MEDTR|nr:putative P-loop containing nucleoside triphosphate hydrolase, leucine-rich repeat domain, L [Medicago truncatula]
MGEMMTKQLSLIGAQGEVATRSGEVALVTASDQIHQLHHLDEEDSWTLFAKHAFHGFDDSYAVSWTKKTTLHEKVGKKVADKCKGLPLALIAIGNLLRRNSSLQHWEKISESDAWDLAEGNRIVPALMVSYQSLPTHLKKCFEYCALFPKGYLYEKDQLCLLWMAENLIQRPRQHMTSMKEVAESYFNDLILRSFFQPSTKYRNYFVMHDLHHDLSKSIFGEFCFTWEGRKSKNMTSITRHFSFLCDEIGSPKGLETLFDAKKLRTFLPLSMTCFEYQWLLCFNSNKLLLSELFSKCKRLRVLSLCGCMDMIELPDNIGNLKHLHHLDLSRTKISKLPDTLCSLHYLQTLKVRDCQFLEELPMNLHKLVNLCYLDFSGTKVTVMPKEMGKLKNLEVLSSFYVGKGNDSSMMDLSVYVYFVT